MMQSLRLGEFPIVAAERKITVTDASIAPAAAARVGNNETFGVVSSHSQNEVRPRLYGVILTQKIGLENLLLEGNLLLRKTRC